MPKDHTIRCLRADNVLSAYGGVADIHPGRIEPKMKSPNHLAAVGATIKPASIIGHRNVLFCPDGRC